MNDAGSQPESTIQASVAPASFYSPELDGLRCCAVMLVFIHHAPQLPLLGAIKTYGWVGVDLFLSISAFLITRLILLEYGRTGTVSLKSFYIRRMLRIWPLYLSFASAVCLLTIIVGSMSTSEVAAWWLSHLTFSNNLMTALDGYSNVLFSSHLWTISLEEQAYLVLPLILVAALQVGIGTRSTLWFCGMAIVMLIVARTGFLLAGARHPFIWVLPLRGDAFIFGAAAAILISQGTLRPREWLFIPGIALISCVALFPSVETPSAYHLIGYTVTALGSTLVVVASQGKLGLSKFLGRQPFRYLGKISYGLYVYHLAALFGADWLVRRAGLPAEWEFMAALAVAIGTAALSYAILERPFLLLKSRYAQIASRPV